MCQRRRKCHNSLAGYVNERYIVITSCYCTILQSFAILHQVIDILSYMLCTYHTGTSEKTHVPPYTMNEQNSPCILLPKTCRQLHYIFIKKKNNNLKNIYIQVQTVIAYKLVNNQNYAGTTTFTTLHRAKWLRRLKMHNCF